MESRAIKCNHASLKKAGTPLSTRLWARAWWLAMEPGLEEWRMAEVHLDSACRGPHTPRLPNAWDLCPGHSSCKRTRAHRPWAREGGRNDEQSTRQQEPGPVNCRSTIQQIAPACTIRRHALTTQLVHDRAAERGRKGNEARAGRWGQGRGGPGRTGN